MQVRWCPLGCCSQQLLVASSNMNEEKEAKSADFPSQGLASLCFHFFSAGLVLNKLNHMAMSPSLTSYVSQHPPTLPLGSQHHLRPAALLSWSQDREARETEPCLLPVVQAEAGTCPWRGCGPAGGCHNLPFMAFCKTPAGFEGGFALSCSMNLSCPGKVSSMPVV